MSIVEKAMEKLGREARPGEDAPEARVEAVTDAAAAGGDRLVSAAQENPVAAGAELAAAGNLPTASSRVGLPSSGPRVHLDIDHLRRAGLLPPEDLAPRIADEYRRLKRPLLAGAFGKGAARVHQGNLIMVGSSLPGEGKTFTSINLALSIVQEMDHTVLLVDADVAKPHISRALELDDKPGLIDVLLDESLDLQEVLVSTDVEGLKVLPAGPVHRQATELLASDRMAALLAEMSERYPDRALVFDTPPLLATTEAQVMAGLMGQILLVVNAGKTPQHCVLQALESMDQSDCVNLVLNKVRTPRDEAYYGYYGHS